MASNVDIANLALTKLGHSEFITSLTSTDTVAKLLNRYWDIVRDALMSEYPWGFVMTRAQLTQDPTTPTYEWAYAYNLPTGIIRIWEMYDANLEIMQEYVREGTQILTNEETVYLRYAQRITDPQRYDPLFVEPFALRLALTIQAGVKKDLQLRQLLEVELEEKLGLAKTLNAIESQINREKRLNMQTHSNSWEHQGR